MRPARLLIALAAGAWFALVTSPVAAAPLPAPVHGHIDYGPVAFDDNQVCATEGFTVHAVLAYTIDYTLFSNPDGSLREIIAHQHQVVTLSANGKTLNENDHWSNFIYPDGHVVIVGADANIRGDHGMVLHDAGRLVIDPDGSVVFQAGKHPQLFGGTFCAGLLP